MKKKTRIKMLSISMAMAIVMATTSITVSNNALTDEERTRLLQQEEQERMDREAGEAEERRQAELQRQREAEEAARQEAERQAAEVARQAEEAARQEAERQATEAARQAEEAAKKQADEAARKQAEEAARKAAEESAKKQTQPVAPTQPTTTPTTTVTPPAPTNKIQPVEPIFWFKTGSVTPESAIEMAQRELDRIKAEQKAKAEGETPEPTPKPIETVIPVPVPASQVIKPEPTETKVVDNKEINRDSSIDETAAQKVIDAFKKEHPTGQAWDGDKFYGTSYKNQYGITTMMSAYGCAGFVYELSDKIYGDGTPAIEIYTSYKDKNVASQVKKYDILHVYGGSHYVMVLDIDEKGNAVVAEANVNGKVLWGDTYNINESEIVKIIRRIPEENFTPEERTDVGINVAKGVQKTLNIERTQEELLEMIEQARKQQELINQKYNLK